MAAQKSPPLLPERDADARVSLRHALTPSPVRWLARLVFLIFLTIPFALAFVCSAAAPSWPMHRSNECRCSPPGFRDR